MFKENKRLQLFTAGLFFFSVFFDLFIAINNILMNYSNTAWNTQ